MGRARKRLEEVLPKAFERLRRTASDDLSPATHPVGAFEALRKGQAVRLAQPRSDCPPLTPSER